MNPAGSPPVNQTVDKVLNEHRGGYTASMPGRHEVLTCTGFKTLLTAETLARPGWIVQGPEFVLLLHCQGFPAPIAELHPKAPWLADLLVRAGRLDARAFDLMLIAKMRDWLSGSKFRTPVQYDLAKYHWLLNPHNHSLLPKSFEYLVEIGTVSNVKLRLLGDSIRKRLGIPGW